MQTDKNTVIGMVLLAVLFFAYFYFSNQQNAAIQAKEKHDKDSIQSTDEVEGQQCFKQRIIEERYLR